MYSGISEKEKQMFIELHSVTRMMQIMTKKMIEDITKLKDAGTDLIADLEYTLSVCSKEDEIARVAKMLFGEEVIRESTPDLVSYVEKYIQAEEESKAENVHEQKEGRKEEKKHPEEDRWKTLAGRERIPVDGANIRSEDRIVFHPEEPMKREEEAYAR